MTFKGIFKEKELLLIFIAYLYLSCVGHVMVM